MLYPFSVSTKPLTHALSGTGDKAASPSSYALGVSFFTMFLYATGWFGLPYGSCETLSKHELQNVPLTP